MTTNPEPGKLGNSYNTSLLTCSIAGNDIVDETPIPPVKLVEKTSTHTTKRNTDGHAPAKGPVVAGNRRGGANLTGNEAGAYPP